MTAKILFVDDEDNILKALKRSLKGEDCEIFTANNGPDALEILAKHEIAVIVCDHHMPHMGGVKILVESIKLCPNAIRIVLTGSKDLKIAQAAINEGQISRFFLKPWDDDHLRAIIQQAVRNYEMEQEVRRLHELTCRQKEELEKWNGVLETKVRERTDALYAAYEDTLGALIAALDSREYTTAGHSRRVATYCLFLALEVDVEHDQLENIYRGALLHDIGKIGVPDAVLLKPGPLEPEERRIIEQHVVIGARFLKKVGYLKAATAIPRWHHERYDGTGYCEGLMAEEIPLPARIFAIVDVYDALRSNRPYKSALPHEQAFEIIVRDAGKHFDPAITVLFHKIPQTIWQELADAAVSHEHFSEVLISCGKIKSGSLVSKSRVIV